MWVNHWFKLDLEPNENYFSHIKTNVIKRTRSTMTTSIVHTTIFNEII